MKYMYMLLLVFLLFGCQQKELDDQSLESEKKTNTIQLQNSSPSNQAEASNQTKAKYLANLATQIPDVDHATALITNRGALVSIDVNKDLDRSRVGSLKYAVLEAVEHDPYGQKVIVVADADLYERMKGMASKMKNGYPVKAITEELANITGRWMPELPINEEQGNKKDQNKQMMDNKKQKELENIHEEQSNHQKD